MCPISNRSTKLESLQFLNRTINHDQMGVLFFFGIHINLPGVLFHLPPINVPWSQGHVIFWKESVRLYTRPWFNQSEPTPKCTLPRPASPGSFSHVEMHSQLWNRKSFTMIARHNHWERPRVNIHMCVLPRSSHVQGKKRVDLRRMRSFPILQ